jgi:hypothetical protein
MTMKEICEYIAETMRMVDGKERDPKKIFEMSPSGELWPVFDLYEQCRTWRAVNTVANIHHPDAVVTS